MNKKLDIQKAPKAFRTISEVAVELNLQTYVIRFWESQFKQIKPMRRKGGRRYYRPRDIEFLKGLKALLHDENHTIKKVKEAIIRKGKDFIISKTNDKTVELPVIKTRKVKIKFSYAGQKTLYIKYLINEEEKFQVNYIIMSLNKLKEQMLARANT